MSAIDALKSAVKNNVRFFAIIVDLNLGDDLDGYVTVKKLKEIDPDIRAIAFTAHTVVPILTDYPKYGFTGVLPKPFSLAELKNALIFD